jgi:hypothetical protein
MVSSFEASLLFALVGFRLAIVEVVVNTFFVTFFFFPDGVSSFGLCCVNL